MNNIVLKQEKVVLIDKNFKKYILSVEDKTEKFKGIGVFNPLSLEGKRYGELIEIGNKNFWILKPSLMDKLKALKRNAQIILPRDAAHIIINCSIKSGDRIVEAGIGSGSLTIVLATMVLPDGKIYSYDKRREFIDHALKNINMANLTDNVITKLKDITTGIDEKDLDAVILDIPNPWGAIEHAWGSLKIGGYFCSYSPLISQVENTVKELKNHNFIEIKTIENIQRELIISEHGTRPSFDMLGHTGYLTFARKIL
jgi:tRNA (adenine57-N1/adenine58-N1)-methyltransferase catalytic subunit